MAMDDPYGWQNSLTPLVPQQQPASPAALPPVVTPGGGTTGAPLQGGIPPYIQDQIDRANTAWLQAQYGPSYQPPVHTGPSPWQQHLQAYQQHQQMQQQGGVMQPGGGTTGAPLQGGQQFQPFDAQRQQRWRDSARQWHSQNWQAQTPSTAAPATTVNALGATTPTTPEEIYRKG